MKIGIFGGTFNPVHHGHLVNMVQAREEVGLDTVLLVPVREPVHKDPGTMASSMHRVAMLELAVQGLDYVQVSDIELARDAPSYTFDTVTELRKKYPSDELYLIIGGDSYTELSSWYRVDQLLTMVTVVVMDRPGEKPGTRVPGQGNFIFLDNPLLEISSSCIVKRLRENKSIKYLVPENVREYIMANRIYIS